MKRFRILVAVVCLWACDTAAADTFELKCKIYGQDAVWLHDLGTPPEYVLDFMGALQGDVDVNWVVMKGSQLIKFDTVTDLDLTDLVGGFEIAVELDDQYKNQTLTMYVMIANEFYGDARVWDEALECACTLVADQLVFNVIGQAWTCYATWEHQSADDSVFRCEY